LFVNNLFAYFRNCFKVFGFLESQPSAKQERAIEEPASYSSSEEESYSSSEEPPSYSSSEEE
jgi:hypothetical protein